MDAEVGRRRGFGGGAGGHGAAKPTSPSRELIGPRRAGTIAEAVVGGRSASGDTSETRRDPKMTQVEVRIRSLEDTDIGEITALDEKIGGRYRPETWERRIGYYLRRDPEASVVAESGGRVIGFMLGEVRSGEFGLEEPTGWIEVLGVDPDFRGQAIGRRLGDHMLEHFRERGAESVRTLVDDGMQEIASFFTALGFEPASLRPFVRRLTPRESEPR